MKKLLICLMLLALLPCCVLAEPIYITDITVSARPLDGSTPTPAPTATPEPTATPTPAPAATPESTATPEPTATPTLRPTVKPYDGEYEIEVDIANQIVTVYRAGSRSAGSIARQMICSTGANGNTPLGEFTMPEVQKEDEREAWYYIAKYQLHVQYASRIVDDILFHSLPSEQNGDTPTADSIAALGTPASHGCIRLRPADARWIAENCPTGTKVSIFDGAESKETLRNTLLETSFCAEEMAYVQFLNGERLLSISSEGEEVEKLQAKLRELGYEIEDENGLFGAQTHAAVVQWQCAHGYVQNGELNREQLEGILASETTPEIAADNAAQIGIPAQVKVDSSLILRSQPSISAQQLDSLRNGTAVRVLAEEGSWCKVQVGNRIGYVSRKYLEYSKD